MIYSKHSGYRAGVRIYPGSKGGDMGGVERALQRQNEIADKMTDFVMKSYQDNRPLVMEAAQNAREDRARQLQLADKADARADEAYEFYQSKEKPLIEQSINDAKEWDSAGNIGQARKTAEADATMAADNAAQQQTRALQRMGINPNSGKFAALNTEMALNKAATVAGMSNAAETQRRIQGVTMRSNAGNMGGATLGNVQGFSGQGSGMGAVANGMAGQPLGFTQANQQQYTSGLTGAGNMYGNLAAGYQNYSNAKDANVAGEWNGIGSLVGMGIGSAKSASGSGIMAFADGGQVTGPGTGTSDEVPAVNKDTGGNIQLSNGEYVISADVVKAKGKEFFDKLQQKYHTPVRNLRSA